ncbi:MAG: zinc dependent phospholipase C family protein [Clostridia bacterium]|nr:zinc dependent phospholipase C family protein [Clostridia bacterium]
MATWIIHLRICDLLSGEAPLPLEAFAVGSVAPDCGRQNEDGLTYTPPKSVSHFSATGRSESIDCRFFARDYLEKARTKREFAFLCGYWCHLLTDKLWGETVFRPTERAYLADFPDRQSFMRAVKRDWYDLDSLYLLGHPDFPAYRTLCGIERFEGEYLPFYPAAVIDEKIREIRNYYERREFDPKRTDYVYLTPERADRFVSTAARLCRETLASIWGRNGFDGEFEAG